VRRHGFRRGGQGLPGTIQLENLIFHAGHNLVVFFVVFEEIGDVQEGVAIQADVDKSRLHARQHPRHPALVDASRQGIFVLPLVVNLDYLIFLDYRNTRFVPVRRDH